MQKSKYNNFTYIAKIFNRNYHSALGLGKISRKNPSGIFSPCVLPKSATRSNKFAISPREIRNLHSVCHMSVQGICSITCVSNDDFVTRLAIETINQHSFFWTFKNLRYAFLVKGAFEFSASGWTAAVFLGDEPSTYFGLTFLHLKS